VASIAPVCGRSKTPGESPSGSGWTMSTGWTVGSRFCSAVRSGSPFLRGLADGAWGSIEITCLRSAVPSPRALPNFGGNGHSRHSTRSGRGARRLRGVDGVPRHEREVVLYGRKPLETPWRSAPNLTPLARSAAPNRPLRDRLPRGGSIYARFMAVRVLGARGIDPGGSESDPRSHLRLPSPQENQAVGRSSSGSCASPRWHCARLCRARCLSALLPAHPLLPESAALFCHGQCLP
jgi:hypothetical protein